MRLALARFGKAEEPRDQPRNRAAPPDYVDAGAGVAQDVVHLTNGARRAIVSILHHART
jgi:hypothetical protein